MNNMSNNSDDDNGGIDSNEIDIDNDDTIINDNDDTIINDNDDNNDDDDDDDVMALPVMSDLEFIAGEVVADTIVTRTAPITITNTTTNNNSSSSNQNNDNNNDDDSDSDNNDNNDNKIEVSSSSSSSSDDDDDDDDDDDEELSMVIKKAAKSLEFMVTEDEDDVNINGPPRTKNEIVDDNDHHNDSSISSSINMNTISKLEKIGVVLYNIANENTIVVQSDTTYNPLNEGSILCNVNGIIMGKINEIFGPINTPFYVIRRVSDKATSNNDSGSSSSDSINNDSSNNDSSNNDSNNTSSNSSSSSSSSGSSSSSTLADFAIGTSVYCAIEYSSFVTAVTMNYKKGSDASNIYDEELPEEDQEYSDDEKETLAKQLKNKAKKSLKRPKAAGIPNANPHHAQGTAVMQPNVQYMQYPHPQHYPAPMYGMIDTSQLNNQYNQAQYMQYPHAQQFPMQYMQYAPPYGYNMQFPQYGQQPYPQASIPLPLPLPQQLQPQQLQPQQLQPQSSSVPSSQMPWIGFHNPNQNK